MAPKRRKTRQTDFETKKARLSCIEQIAIDFNIGECFYDYCYLELFAQNALLHCSSIEPFYKLIFKVSDFTSPICYLHRPFDAIIFANQKDELFLAFYCGETLQCSKLVFTPINSINLNFDQAELLFKALASKKCLNVYWFLDNSGSTTFVFDIFISPDTVIRNLGNLDIYKLNKLEPILKVMSIFYDHSYFPANISHKNENLSIDFFYLKMFANQTKQHLELETISLAKLDTLKPTLRPYQELAVKWMIRRENYNSLYDDQLSFFVKHKLAGEDLYYHTVLGYFFTPAAYDEYIGMIKLSSGGILADEMGLGKTVETLSLILQNPKKVVKPILESNKLFSFTNDPLSGILQCTCGKKEEDLRIFDLDLNSLLHICNEQKYYLFEKTAALNKREEKYNQYIKCLQCGNFQHLICSTYRIDLYDFPYFCSRCWKKVERIDTSCTLIVCPNSILQQWLDEIEKHLKNVKVFKYRGVRAQGYIFPPNLAKNDIVITTYDILRSEIDYTIDHDFKHLRNSKRYVSPLSPLLAINWWRLCMDEAQLVEGTFSLASQMADHISTSHRWAITGTPLQRSVNDLFGLLYFIHEEPFCNRLAWNQGLFYPYLKSGDIQPLLNAVSNCFWRTSKNEVFEEIGISKSIYTTKLLQFSQIERDFYSRQANHYKNLIQELLTNVSRKLKLSELSSIVYHKILNGSIKLRQTCCHPQISLGQQSVKQFDSLKDVLDKMIQESKYDCEKYHREKIAAMNGTACAYLQMENFQMAIQTYKEALNSIKKYEEFLRTDQIQIYHIYYNLSEIVELFGCRQLNENNVLFPAFNGEQINEFDLDSKVVDKTTLNIVEEDRFCRQKAKQIYDKYLFSDQLALVTTNRYRIDQISKCNRIRKSFALEGKWFIAALSELSSALPTDEMDSFLSYYLASLSSNSIYNISVESMKMLLYNHMKSIDESRQNMINIFSNLEKNVNEIEVKTFINCHVKFTKRNNKKCILCLAEINCSRHEKNLFNVQYRTIPEEDFAADGTIDNLREGNWNENSSIIALRKLGQLYKSKCQSADYEMVVSDIDIFTQYIDEVKKEFKTHRKYWTKLSELILRKDELNQAQTRFIVPIYLPSMGAEKSIKDLIETQILSFNCDKERGEIKLTSDLGRLKYLIQLKTSLKEKDGVEARMCCICWQELKQYMMLPCGHFFCVECTTQLEKHTVGQHVKCSICRSTSKKELITFLDFSTDKPQLNVKGSWSTKIVNIVRHLLDILNTGEKVLLFSTWSHMLRIMNNALEMNGIQTLLIDSSNRQFVAHIKNFHNDQKFKVLLLPTNFACNGLNLVEASHVIFVNSSLNKADELQAIGRIHRIGQTRQTYVHKFIVKDTIEELIEEHHNHIYYKSKNRNSEFNDLSVEQFFHLFCPSF